jgi:glycosyltransferase involved in cell wall biosynthesis
VCLTYAAERIIRDWPQYKTAIPLEVIPCSVDMVLFDPAKIDGGRKAELKKKLGIAANDFVISYLGSIGGWYLTDEMMQFCRIVSDKIATAKFLFISHDSHAVILKTAHRYGIPPEKIVVTHAKRHEVPLLLSLSSYSLFFIKSCYSKKSSSPTKHGEIMAMGIPVVTNTGVGDVAQIVETYKSGIVLNKLDEQEFFSAAEYMANDTVFDGKLIRNSAKEVYDLQSAIDKYRKIYDLILVDA